MSNLLNWKEIDREGKSNGAQFNEESNEWEEVVYLGSILSLAPSGKYYTVFANNNVTDEEAEEDADWREKLEAEAEKHNWYVSQGDNGDGLDVFLHRIVKKPKGAKQASDSPKAFGVR